MKLTDRLKQLDTASMTSREIADALRMNYDYVRVHLAQNNIPYRKLKDGKAREFKPHKYEALVLKMHRQGVSPREMRERIKIAPETIKKIIERNERNSQN